jgi:hypothetical protein
MSSEQSGKSHAVAWMFSILAVPVLYFLSGPPLYILATGHRTTSAVPFPRWLEVYAVPGNWLCEQIPSLGKPLMAYEEWCNKSAGAK